KADVARRDAHELHAAIVLRRALRRGEPCPVCAQDVQAVPKAIASPELDAVTERYDRAKRAEAEASHREKEITAEHAGLAAAAGELAKAAVLAKGAAQQAAGRTAQIEEELVKTAQGKFDGESGAAIEERVLFGIKRLVNARDGHHRESE